MSAADSPTWGGCRVSYLGEGGKKGTTMVVDADDDLLYP